MNYDMGKLIRNLAMLCLVFAAIGCSRSEVETVRLSETDGNSNCYTAILPKNGEIRSYMLLLPGFGEAAVDVLSATDLPFQAAEDGMAVFIPTLQDGVESYGFSAESQRTLGNIVRDIVQRYGLDAMPYSVGGFSMGGAAAVKFAETSPVKPTHVFAIDSPLDYERFRFATERDVKVYRKGIAEGDSIYVKLLEDITPIVQDSPYSLSDTTHRAILPLVDIPVRFYIEPAEQWWLDNRGTDVLGLNILDGTAFINDLRLLGNGRAEFIATSGKGYRNRGKTYHPHSWTIVDNKDLIRWLSEN